MHSFEVHSNESVCRKSGCLGLEQVYKNLGTPGLDQEKRDEFEEMNYRSHYFEDQWNYSEKEVSRH